MLRGFRHTLFLLLQIGVLLSGGVAIAIWPDAWRAVAACVLGSFVASLICERLARRYLRFALGKLRRTAEQVSAGNPAATIEVHPGDDFYKLVSAVNHVVERVAEASREERRLHEELRRRERLAFLGELAASVAHEINNPLDGIQNCARILRRSQADPQRAAQMLDLIDGGLERIELIVRRLLTLAREHVIRPTVANVHEIVDSALAAAQVRLDECAIRVTRKYDAGDDPALVDPLLLQQVFTNLIVNAADAMSAGGELRVAITRVGGNGGEVPGDGCDSLRIEFADSGPGIPADIKPHIFEPFYTTKQRGRGTGLGLPIAARIVDAHDGALSICERDGAGAVFVVTIPTLSSRASVFAAIDANAERAATRSESRPSA